MTDKVRSLFKELNLLTEFARYKNIMLNTQDNEFLWGYLESIQNRYLNNGVTEDDISTLEELSNKLLIDYKDSYRIWRRNKKIEGLL